MEDDRNLTVDTTKLLSPREYNAPRGNTMMQRRKSYDDAQRVIKSSGSQCLFNDRGPGLTLLGSVPATDPVTAANRAQALQTLHDAGFQADAPISPLSRKPSSGSSPKEQLLEMGFSPKNIASADEAGCENVPDALDHIHESQKVTEELKRRFAALTGDEKVQEAYTGSQRRGSLGSRKSTGSRQNLDRRVSDLKAQISEIGLAIGLTDRRKGSWSNSGSPESRAALEQRKEALEGDLVKLEGAGMPGYNSQDQRII